MPTASPEFGFRVVSILATGSSSTVVLAEPLDEERRVVVKVVQPELAKRRDVLARTRDEARLLARLQHPNIVAVERLTEYRGRPVLVLEHVDGVDLAAVGKVGPLPAGDALEVVRQVALALDAAWRTLHVVHRDIKPENVLLSVQGDVKIVDFGLARAEFDDRESKTDVVLIGSLGYVAPERFDAADVTPAADVYALGVMLVVLTTGQLPVVPRSERRHDAELARQLAHVAPPDLDDADQGALRALVADMCAYDAERRPTAAEVARQAAALVRTTDLQALAQARVVPRRQAAPQGAPQEHPLWDRVAFLDARSRPARRPSRLLRLLGRR